MGTYEQTEKELSFFNPKRQVQDNGSHTKPLSLQEPMQCDKFLRNDALL